MTPILAEHVSLQALNTLAVDVAARFFVAVEDPDTIPAIIDFANERALPLLVLGEGSNLVLSEDFPGVVMKVALGGIDVRHKNDTVILDVAAGEHWHTLVEWTLQQGYYGLENLALIPGTVGAAPIQNIGAYGVELARCLDSVTGWDIAAGEWRTLSGPECHFGYRDSVFKHRLRDRFVITGVRLRLSRTPAPCTDYRALQTRLQELGIVDPTPEQVARAVMDVRRSKLPDPATVPNVGSFFQNPVVTAACHERLLERWPALVSYPQTDGRYKLAAGWLVEQAGWKGRGHGPVGVHEHQSLVLVNRGGASGADILALAEQIVQDVREQFGVSLTIEPRVY